MAAVTFFPPSLCPMPGSEAARLEAIERRGVSLAKPRIRCTRGDMTKHLALYWAGPKVSQTQVFDAAPTVEELQGGWVWGETFRYVDLIEGHFDFKLAVLCYRGSRLTVEDGHYSVQVIEVDESALAEASESIGGLE